MTKKSENRQKQILRYIYGYIDENRYPPTVREIGEAVGLSSTSTVHGHLQRLEKSGFITRNSSKPRALEITNVGFQELGVFGNDGRIPMVGVVTAGNPITAIEETTEFFPIPDDLKHSTEALFMLTIRGESMINAGIYDGDRVIVRQQPDATNGDIVIAMTDEDEATCKRFFKEDNYIRLQPENDTMDPIILDNVQILGVVTGLYRENVI